MFLVFLAACSREPRLSEPAAAGGAEPVAGIAEMPGTEAAAPPTGERAGSAPAHSCAQVIRFGAWAAGEYSALRLIGARMTPGANLDGLRIDDCAAAA
ncbi:hypothetical protein [Haliangium ochraceum]|nr:hypothetical protein [Haliangium ochraceum]